jgi:penicillin-binding protein activator
MHFPKWLALALFAAATGCGPEYVRGSDEPGLDDPAMSTGLDKRDLQKLMHDNMEAFLASPVAHQWNQDRSMPRVAIFPLANETSEHIDSQLDALLGDVETYLVNSNLVTPVSLERQPQLMAEVRNQNSGGFDPAKVAEVNKQLGTQFFMTGKVFTADERTRDGRRVQYFMFMQLIEVETSAIKWQNKTEVTKALLD